jgi:molecular chaperone DnaJ
MRTYYELLNLDKDADKRDIKRAFHELAKRLHPDVYRSRVSDAGGFLEVLAAYETLIDDRKRDAYNASLRALEEEIAKGSAGRNDADARLPKSRVTFALSLKDVASFRSPPREGKRRRRGLSNPKGYHVCVELTESELARGSLIEIDVPAHVVCPVCGGDRVSCAFCSSRGQVLRAVPVTVPIPGHLGHGDVFAVPLRTVRGRGDAAGSRYAFFMIDTLLVKVRIFEDSNR